MEEMGALAQDDQQITLFYHSGSRLGKQALAYADASKASVRTIDISQTKLGDTVWMELQEKTGKSFPELLATDHPDSPDLKSRDLHPNDWVKTLKNHPALLQNPIAVRGESAIQLSQPSDILQLIGVDSAGLEKPPLGDPPPTGSQSEGESFV